MIGVRYTIPSHHYSHMKAKASATTNQRHSATQRYYQFDMDFEVELNSRPPPNSNERLEYDSDLALRMEIPQHWSGSLTFTYHLWIHGSYSRQPEIYTDDGWHLSKRYILSMSGNCFILAYYE